MKKILSLLAAGALALGLIGCSGNLHDDVFVASTPLYIEGAVTPDNARVQMTVVDDSTQKYEFTYTKEMSSSWGSPKDGVCFKVMKSADGWTDDFGGKNDTNLEVAVGSEIKLFKRGSSEAPTNPGNIQVAGLKAGTKYAINLSLENWGQASEGITLKVTNEGGGSSTVEADPTPYYLHAFFVAGDMNKWESTADTVLKNPSVEKKTGIVTYTYDFKAQKYNWTDNKYEDATGFAFGIKDATSDWKHSYRKADFNFATDKDYVKLVADAGENCNVSGLTAGKNYRMYIQTTPENEVSYKIVALNELTVTVSISKLPTDSDIIGKTLYMTGDYNGWKEPGADKEADKVYPVTIAADGTGQFTFNVTYEGSTYSQEYQGKIASTGWTKPEICGEDGENAKFTITETKKSVKVVYSDMRLISGNAKASENGNQYLCEWTVE